MALSLVLDGPCFGPGCGDIRQVECLSIIPISNTAIVGDQIDFHKTRFGLIPVGKGADRDVMLQERARFGARTAFETTVGFGGC